MTTTTPALMPRTVTEAAGARAPIAEVEALIRDYTAAWNARDPDLIAGFHAADGIFQLHSGDSAPVRGREAVRDTFAGLLAQFPDLAFSEQELIAGPWGWVARWRMSATLASTFEAGGRHAQPGSRFEIDAVDVITASRGRIDAKHTYLDWQARLEQLGLA